MDKLYKSLKHEVVKVKREAKRVADVETPLEMNMREATSNQNSGCSNTVLYDIALSSQSYEHRRKIMVKIWEKLDVSKAVVGSVKWRRILKTATLLEFLIKNGAQEVVGEVLSEQKKVDALQSFKYVEDGADKGLAIREKAKFILEMITDKELLKAEREKAKEHRNKFACAESHGGGSKPRASSGSSIGAVASSIVGDSGRIKKTSFENRFNELQKKKEEDCKPSWEKPDFIVKEGEKDRDRGRSDSAASEERETRPKFVREGGGTTSISRDSGGGRSSAEKDKPRDERDAGGGDGYALYDRDKAGASSDSDSSSDRASIDQSPKTLPKPPGSGKEAVPDMFDLLDTEPASGTAFDPPSRVAAPPSADWAAFGEAAPSSSPAAPASNDWAAFGSAPANAPSGTVDPFGSPANASSGALDPFAAPINTTSGMSLDPFASGKAASSGEGFDPFG